MIELIEHSGQINLLKRHEMAQQSAVIIGVLLLKMKTVFHTLGTNQLNDNYFWNEKNRCNLFKNPILTFFSEDFLRREVKGEKILPEIQRFVLFEEITKK